MKIANLNKWSFATIVVLLLTTSGCVVSKKQYNKLATSFVSSETELLKRRSQVQSLMRDTLEKGARYRSCEKLLSEAEYYSEYAQSQLFKRLNTLQSELDAKEKLLFERERTLATKETDLATKNAQLSDVRKKLDDQNKLVLSVRFLVADAVSAFNSPDVVTEVDNEKVRIRIPDAVLFKGNTMTKEGEQALLNLSAVVSQNPSFYASVEAHTDNASAKGSTDVWELTALRAANVARVLAKGGMNPRNLTAAGKGDFAPIGDNLTPEGRAINRRIEIILAPELTYLYQLLKMTN